MGVVLVVVLTLLIVVFALLIIVVALLFAALHMLVLTLNIPLELVFHTSLLHQNVIGLQLFDAPVVNVFDFYYYYYVFYIVHFVVVVVVVVNLFHQNLQT